MRVLRNKMTWLEKALFIAMGAYIIIAPYCWWAKASEARDGLEQHIESMKADLGRNVVPAEFLLTPPDAVATNVAARL